MPRRLPEAARDALRRPARTCAARAAAARRSRRIGADRCGPPGSCGRRRGSRRRPSSGDAPALERVDDLGLAVPTSAAVIRPSATIAVLIMPGQIAVTPILCGASSLAQRLREPAHGELARDVRGHARRRVDAEDDRDVDDVAAGAALDHLRDEEVAAVDDAAQVDAEQPVPVVERRVEERAADRDARVVDDDIGRAATARGPRRRTPASARDPRRRPSRRASARSPSSDCERVEPRLIDIARGDAGALARQTRARSRGRCHCPRR